MKPLKGSYFKPPAEKWLHLDLIPHNISETYSIWPTVSHHTAVSDTPLHLHSLCKSDNLTIAAFRHAQLSLRNTNSLLLDISNAWLTFK